MSHWDGLNRKKPCRRYGFALRDTAEKYAEYIRNNLGKENEAYECLDCGRWHVQQKEKKQE